MNNALHFINQLEQLETLLRNFKHWCSTSPDLSLVTNPFGVNQISLYEWLQFIYLPRMRSLLALGQVIPKSEIHPYAEQVIDGHNGADAILDCIKTLDSLSAGATADE